MEAPPTDSRTVDEAVASLQERLADGDPADVALRSHCEAVLLALRGAYRVTPTAFSREAIEALREISELLHETDPAPHTARRSAEPHDQRPPEPLASRLDEAGSEAPAPRGTEEISAKEFAKKMRHAAYLRAKEYRKTDPRQIAMQEKLKQQRRDAFQKVKERGKALRAERKKAADEKAAADRVAKGQALLATPVPASTLKPVTKRRP